MQIGQKFSSRLYSLNKSNHGGIFGLVAMTISLVGIIIPLIDFPSFNIFISMVSHLGLPGMSSAYLFLDICFIISGLLNIPNALSIGHFFKQIIGKNKWITVAVLWNCFSSMSLMFVGLFLSFTIYINDIFHDIHVLFAITMFLGVAVYSFIYGNLIINNSDKFPISLAIICYITAGMQLSFLLTWKSYLEWFATFLIIGWNIMMSLYMLYRK